MIKLMHAQTVLEVEKIERLKQLTKEGAVKDALYAAVDHYLDCQGGTARMLTRDRLKDKILEWWRNSGIPTITESQIQALADSIETEAVQVAKEAHQRGREGKAF